MLVQENAKGQPVNGIQTQTKNLDDKHRTLAKIKELDFQPRFFESGTVLVSSCCCKKLPQIWSLNNINSSCYGGQKSEMGLLGLKFQCPCGGRRGLSQGAGETGRCVLREIILEKLWRSGKIPEDCRR